MAHTVNGENQQHAAEFLNEEPLPQEGREQSLYSLWNIQQEQERVILQTGRTFLKQKLCSGNN